MTHMIEVTGVVKRFGHTTALDGLELVAEQGAILAVLGPNRAGKTTFVRCIATLIKPESPNRSGIEKPGWPDRT